MLWYMTAEKAKQEGFTHHGKYYGIPVWIGDPDGDCMVATKWAPLEPLMTLFHYIEGFMHSMMHPYDEPYFQFQVGERIE
jgi:hypothetical protein